MSTLHAEGVALPTAVAEQAVTAAACPHVDAVLCYLLLFLTSPCVHPVLAAHLEGGRLDKSVICVPKQKFQSLHKPQIGRCLLRLHQPVIRRTSQRKQEA